MASTRREFLNRVIAAASALLTGYILYPLIRFFTPPPAALGEVGRVFVATTDEMKLNSAKFFKFLDRPAVLVRLPDGSYKALSAKCTHMGCTVQFKPSSDFFLCECHGSEFNINGGVIRGPATLPLPRYLVTITGDKIYVSVKNQVA